MAAVTALRLKAGKAAQPVVAWPLSQCSLKAMAGIVLPWLE
jgi:hypothetical protein